MNNAHLNNANIAQESNNNASGGELPQKQISKKDKRKAIRVELKKLSQQAKVIKLEMVQNAETIDAKIAADNLKINEIILMTYKDETGFTDFRTFADWRKAGYKINRGVNGFPVWGKPRSVKDKITDEEGHELESDEWEFYPICYLFHEGQVTKKDLDSVDARAANDAEIKGKEDEQKPTDELLKVSEPSAFVNADYVERLEARKQRLQERADRKSQESDTYYQRSHDRVKHVPLGQPILCGHHSERAHRNTLDKSWSDMGKSVALDKQARNLQGRAASVGTGGISSTDPEAIQKLKTKLSNLEKSQDTMKAVNKIVRSKKLADSEKAAKIVDDGLLGENYAQEILKPDFAGRVGFASYALQNNNAEIRRTRERIEELQRLHSSDPIEFESDDFSMFVDNGQIVIDFPGGKPNEAVRTMMKRTYSFKFSRYRGAWVRKATSNALAAAGQALEWLKAVDEIY